MAIASDDCNECYGDGWIEHVGCGIVEECEHCKGTGRKDCDESKSHPLGKAWEFNHQKYDD